MRQRRRSRAAIGVVAALAALLGACSSSESTGTAEVGTTQTTVAPVGSPGCASPDQAFVDQGDQGTFVADGTPRHFRIDAPSVQANEPLPLVVNMHGGLGTSDGQETMSGLGAQGVELGYITIAPQATNEPGRRPVWDISEPSADLDYVEALIAETGARLCVDTSRVYLTGFSMGAMMSMILACRQPDQYAAIALVAGAIEAPACAQQPSMPMVAFHGTDDRAVFFDGGYDPNVALLVGATDGPGRAEIVEDWAIGNGCTDDPSTKPIDPDVEKIEYECPSGDDVDFYVIEGGKHAWPRGGRTPPSGLAETTTTAIDASTRIWDFFTQHQRAP